MPGPENLASEINSDDEIFKLSQGFLTYILLESDIQLSKNEFIIHIQALFVSFLLFLKHTLHSMIPSERGNVTISTVHQNEFSWKYSTEPPKRLLQMMLEKNV